MVTLLRVACVVTWCSMFQNPGLEPWRHYSLISLCPLQSGCVSRNGSTRIHAMLDGWHCHFQHVWLTNDGIWCPMFNYTLTYNFDVIRNATYRLQFHLELFLSWIYCRAFPHTPFLSNVFIFLHFISKLPKGILILVSALQKIAIN